MIALLENTSYNKRPICLDDYEVFNMLSESQKVIIEVNAIIKSAQYQEIIYISTQFVYFLLKGKVMLGKSLNQHNEMVTGIISPSNFLSVSTIFNTSSNSEYAQALTEVSYLRIDLAIIKKLMNTNFRFSRAITCQVYKHLQRIENRIETLHLNVDSRVCRFLIELAEEFGEPVGSDIMIKIRLTHNEMARFINGSRQSVCQVMNELRRNDAIYYERKKILIRSIEQLSEWPHKSNHNE